MAPEISVDPSKPTIKLLVRLLNGKSVPITLNTDHKLSDLRLLIEREMIANNIFANTELFTSDQMLLDSELDDMNLIEIGLKNASVVRQLEK